MNEKNNRPDPFFPLLPIFHRWTTAQNHLPAALFSQDSRRDVPMECLYNPPKAKNNPVFPENSPFLHLHVLETAKYHGPEFHQHAPSGVTG